MENIHATPVYLYAAARRIADSEMMPLLPAQRLASHRLLNALEAADGAMDMRHSGDHYANAQLKRRGGRGFERRAN